jgi:type I restriction enzyme M protein
MTVVDAPREVSSNLTETFRRLYYHLYTNSHATRAETIVEDLSLLLLLKLAAERANANHLLAAYCDRGGSSIPLLEVLRREFPDLVAADRRFKIGEDALRHALRDLRDVSLSTAPGHALGEAFQALIGPRLRGDKGQFFTPRSLVAAMVRIAAPRPDESVLDPACGTGGFLVEAAVYQAAAGRARGAVIGAEKDHDLSGLAGALLQITAGARASVRHASSLDLSVWGITDGEEPTERFDVILTNPPFGAKIGVKDADVLRRYAFGHRWSLSTAGGWTQTPSLLPSQDPQLLFLELCVRLLRPGGRLGIVLPEGVFGNKGEGYVWQWLSTHGRILALLDCPRTTFQPSTDTKTNALFFERAKHVAVVGPTVVRVGVALTCGHDRRGRSRLANGSPHPDDFVDLGRTYHAKDGAKTWWRDVQLTRMDYLVPRYYAERRPITPQEKELTRGATWASLGDLVASKLLTIRKGHEVGSDAYGTGDIPFVRTSDIANFEISADPTKAVSGDIYEKFSKQQRVKAGDVLMVVDGRYRIGATAMLTKHNSKCVVQSHFRIIGMPRPQQLDPYEVLFALNLPSVRLRIRDLIFIQSTLGTLGKRLLELKIPTLHGDGPWRSHVDAFRRLLSERDLLLGELATRTGPELEL